MFFLLIAILFSSCHKDAASTSFIDYGQKLTLFTQSVEVLDSASVNSFKNITVDNKEAKLALSLKTYFDHQPIRLCLYLQKKNIFWYESQINIKCPENGNEVPDDLKILSNEYKKMQIYFFTQDRRIDSQTLIKKNHLVFKIDDYRLTFPLRNLDENKILPLNFKRPQNKFLPDGEICYEVDEKCQVIKNNCKNCEAGFMPVISSKCEKDFTKICSTQSCGKRAAPACVRGYNYNAKPIEAGCFDNAASAYCQEGLSSYCDEKNILVCR